VSGVVDDRGKRAAGEKQGRKPWTLREFGGQTVWDWLHLLSALAIPVVLAIVGLWFTAQQDARQQQIEDNRAQQAQKIENQRAEAERELAEQRAQDETLQAYLSQMSQLMLERKLLEAEPGDPVHTLAQARTSTVILRLDAEHNESVTLFLTNSGLALRNNPSGALLTGPEASARLLRGITLSHATLSNANLPDADLNIADLRGADLSNAILIYANLNSANLSGADLSNAYLYSANLSMADMYSADLSGALLQEADLSDAQLLKANLRRADLSNADLSKADLSNADLAGAKGITSEELVEQQARSLEGATMPNGQKYEDWLKAREKRQQDE
jgi:uncharacterized protein YjbI with pentapeptide repeats